MYSRILKPPLNKSFFLFGPRGTGKTTWLKSNFPKAIYIDLLEAENFNPLIANPQRLETFLPPNFSDWIILDEVQRIPELLNEVHRLIENRKLKFILTGSSARKLKKNKNNLLAGRALTYRMYPLTVQELGKDFDLQRSLKWGQLPATFSEENVKKYLDSYIMTYLEQEILQEGLTRNIAAFSRFLETASFSQGEVLNLTEVSREASVHRKVTEDYFSILEDLMIAYRVPVFTRKAKRRLLQHKKFYFFDVGIYRTLRPSGPLDSEFDVQGPALETLVLQELIAVNDYLELGYKIYYWRTADKKEVDFVLYGARNLLAIEVKRSGKIGAADLKGLQAFLSDYPSAKGYVLYGGKRRYWEGNIEIVPIEFFLQNIQDFL